MKRAGLFAAVILALGVPIASAPIASAQSAEAAMDADEMVVLKPGQFVWYETEVFRPASMIPGNGISIVISIPAQLAYVYRDGILIAVSTVSTGSEGRETPIGEFTILQKRVFHRSNLYSNAPMPFMQRLTWGGIALHAGHLPGYPASHGCIRLPKEFARKLYAVTALGAAVSVTDEVIDDPRYNPWGSPPTMRVDTASLSGERFDTVTASSSLIEAVKQQPVSWVTGPVKEIVQPIPAGAH